MSFCRLLKTMFLSKGSRWRYLVVDHPPGKEVRFRVHLDEQRRASAENVIIMRTGKESEMLAALESDYQAALKEGWQLDGAIGAAAS